jgi:predicted ATPase
LIQDHVILTRDQRDRVFISGTIGELAEERAAAISAVEQLRQHAVHFGAGATPHDPVLLYRELLAQSDIFIGIYWQSYGQLVEGMTISGIEDEFDRARDMPRLIYIKDADTRDPRLDELLDRVRSESLTYKRFRTADELRNLVADDLAQILSERSHRPTEDRASGVPKLPPSLSPIIGRKSATEDLVRLLNEPDVRLLTLVGPGGVGKTRLGIEAGHQVEGQYRDGSACVDLSSITDPALLPETILHTLGLPTPISRSPLETLRSYFSPKQFLLVLDNFEQIVESGPVLTQLLASSPGLKILATSRAPLRVEGEREYLVEPMELPDLGALPSVDDLAMNESVTLFARRAQAVRSKFRLNESNARSVAEICVRLEGLPLAIELAAARIRLFEEPAELLERLDPLLPMLVDGRRDAPHRQRTMGKTIQWSYDLLDFETQALFRRSGVFPGGCTFESAEAIAHADASLSSDVVDGLAKLVEASLLRVSPGTDGVPRLRMFETVREFAVDRLNDGGERDAIDRGFVAFFVDLTYELAKRHKGTPDRVWFDQIEGEIDNLRASLNVALARNDSEALVRLVWNLWRFWNVRGYLAEAEEWLELALSHGATVEDFILTDVKTGAATFARRRHDYSRAESLMQDVLKHYQHNNDPQMQVSVLMELSSIAYYRSDFVQDVEYLEQAESLSREAGYRLGMLQAQVGMGALKVDLQDFDGARPILEAAIRELREMRPNGDDAALVTALSHLGRVEQAQGDLGNAIAHIEESIAIMEAVGDTRGRATSLISLARMHRLKMDTEQAKALVNECLELGLRLPDLRAVAMARLEQGRYEWDRPELERRELLLDSLKTFQEIDEPRGVAESLEGLAIQLVAREPALSTEVLGAVERQRELLEFRLFGGDLDRHQQRLNKLRETLGETPFGEAWRKGYEQELRATVRKLRLLLA